jgi:hypothetical protein
MKRFVCYGIALVFVLVACEPLDDEAAGPQRSEETLFAITSIIVLLLVKN